VEFKNELHPDQNMELKSQWLKLHKKGKKKLISELDN
jgi:hypothetical protein